jgi:hypothetical protein
VETITLTYKTNDVFAKKTLDYFLSLGIFQMQKAEKNQVQIGMDEYRQGKYTVVNKGKNGK